MTTTTVTQKHRQNIGLPVLDRWMIFNLLTLMTAVGVVASIWRLLTGLGSATNLTDGYPWGIWIGFDFTLIAFAGTGFTMAAVVHVLRLKQFEDAVRPAILAGLVGYVSVLLLLVIDLGRPDRFYHFILFWNMHSPLFEISWCVLLYTTVLLIETSPFLLERIQNRFLLKLTQKIMLPVTILGVTLSSLHQSTLGTLYLNMPHRLNQLWYTPILPLLFFTSSVMAGLSLAILAYKASNHLRGRPVKPGVARGLGKGIAGVGVFYLLLKLGDIILAGEFSHLLAFDRASALMGLELGAGVILPILLFLSPATRDRRIAQIGGPVLVLFGVLLNRFDATMFMQVFPAGITYSPHILEWVSTIGILSAGVLIWWIGIRFLVIFDSKEGH